MKKVIIILSLGLIYANKVMAQGCAVCKETTAGMGNESANGLNNGILYLAALPLLFMAIVGVVWYRRNKDTI